MNLSFEHTMPMDGKSSCIASLALVNPSHLCPCEPHNRVEHRRAAELHRSPEQNSKTLLQLSPIAIPLESGNILSVNIANHFAIFFNLRYTCDVITTLNYIDNCLNRYNVGVHLFAEFFQTSYADI